MIRVTRIFAVFIAAVVVVLCACDCSRENKNLLPFEKFDGAKDGFSVHFIDVGNGDATLLRFPDGKTALIDCGGTETHLETVKRYLDFYAVDGLDYFILSHPDIESIGNAEEIIKGYSIKTIIAPETLNPERFPVFNAALNAAKEREIKIETARTLKNIVGENYALLFLSPDASEIAGSPYDDYNGTEPNATAINNVAPIIYVECFGVRFILAGDADESVQQTVYENIISGFYDKAIAGFSPDFEKIDFFRVPKHGATGGINYDLWNYLESENAVIASTPEGDSRMPADSALIALTYANRSCSFRRTDELGAISVFVADGITKTVTQFERKSA